MLCQFSDLPLNFVKTLAFKPLSFKHFCLLNVWVSVKRRLGAGVGVNFLTFLKTFTDSEKKII